MALEHHQNHQMRFEQQVENSRNYVIPFIERSLNINAGLNVLEIGCGEGGVLKPFAERGCECLGVELDEPRIILGAEFLKNEIAAGKIRLIKKNVYDDDFCKEYDGYFDLILLKDVIEHIPDQEKFIPYMKRFLKPKGQIYFGYPPWYMPFGGHQQIAKTKWASKLPYYHVLPMPLYLGLLKWMGESENTVAELKEVKETGITMERFERIVKKSGYTIVARQWYLINPIYRYKFGLKPRKQNMLFGLVPYLRDFLTTCAYYTIQRD